MCSSADTTSSRIIPGMFIFLSHAFQLNVLLIRYQNQRYGDLPFDSSANFLFYFYGFINKRVGKCL